MVVILSAPALRFHTYSDLQLTHHNSKFTPRSFPIVLIAEHIANASNLGGLFRAADAFGVEQLFLSENCAKIGGRMTRSSRATEKSVDFEIRHDLQSLIAHLKSENYAIVCLEITSQSQSLRNYNISPEKKIALIVGNERLGISDELLSLADAHLHLDMFGQNSSMNVVQATSIALYEITSQLLT